jgi:hypothetical protein
VTNCIYCRTRGDLYKNITPDYYGYRDDDDGILAQKEAKREVRTFGVSTRCRKTSSLYGNNCNNLQKELVAKAEKEFQVRKAEVVRRMRTEKGATFTPAELALVENSDEEDGEAEIQKLISDSKAGGGSGSGAVSEHAGSAAVDAELRAHVNLPSREDINELLLAEKRKALLAKISAL